MTELLSSIGRAVLVWGAATVCLCGLGCAVRRLFGRRVGNGESFLRLAWLGWGVAIVLLQLWHFWLPVRGWACASIALVGMLGFAWCLPDLWQSFVTEPRRNMVFLVLLLVIACWMAHHSLTQANNYDSGLYQLTSVRWAYTYPVVPGLGNLHARLAFNNSYFLYVAGLDWGWFAGRSHQVAGGLLLLWAIARSAVGGYYVLLSRTGHRMHHLLDLLLLVPVLRLPMFGYHFHANPSPDLGVYMLGFIAGSELLRLLEKCYAAPGITVHEQDDEGAFDFVFLVFLCAVGVTIKLSFAVFALLAHLYSLCSVLCTPAIGSIITARIKNRGTSGTNMPVGTE